MSKYIEFIIYAVLAFGIYKIFGFQDFIVCMLTVIGYELSWNKNKEV